MNRQTGGTISTQAHIAQSIADILTTPLGSRLMRRDYGSLLPSLIDAPANQTTLISCYAAIASALIRWEPRITLNRVQLSDLTTTGSVVLDVDATFSDSNEAVGLTIPLSLGASA